MIRRFILVALFVLLATDATVHAQAPTYSPYGAWRGRIRYVEGPFRTRSTIRWSNGITPVGGQVLIQGLTSAENVLTNQDFLNAAIAGSGRDTDVDDSELHLSIEKLHDENKEIRTRLNGVRKEWGLLDLPSTAAADDQTNQVADDAAVEAGLSPSIANLLVSEITDNAKILLGLNYENPAEKVVGYGKFIEGRKDEFILNAKQLETIGKLNEYAAQLTTKTEAPTDTDNLMAVLQQYLEFSDDMISKAKEAKKASTLMLDASALLVKHGQARGAFAGYVEIATEYLKTVGDIPPFEKRLFDEVKLKTDPVVDDDAHDPVDEDANDDEVSDDEVSDDEVSDDEVSDDEVSDVEVSDLEADDLEADDEGSDTE